MIDKKKASFVTEAINKTGQELGIKNINAYPKIEKVVVHIGIGKDRDNKSVIESLVKDIMKISGQKPSFRNARKSIATFKVRTGEPIGLMVTLRGKKMFDFLDKLIHVSLPAIRDFRGLPKTSFDKQGNYSIGIREHTVFPEISFSNDSFSHGIQITIATKSDTPDQTMALFKNLGFPFSNQ